MSEQKLAQRDAVGFSHQRLHPVDRSTHWIAACTSSGPEPRPSFFLM